ncbi:nucleotidyltransferase domain-containing protein [Candidatus Woesearchaeota archaeon]|nr:nucleotidyltransferase domain-containing protein [Candidatus Woesearchaeota archaeon]MBW3005417.1 nucleotidyltransferase domain-containing protein [Candidatus Woesearchaeota archaeon]
MIFWKKWKNITEQEKAAIKVLLQIKRLVLKKIPKENIISIYCGGSFPRREMTSKSDVDIWVIVTDTATLKIFPKLWKLTKKKYELPSGISGYALWELKTGKHSKQITKKRTGPRRFVKYMPNYHLIYGKKLKQKDFKTRTDLEDLLIMLKTFKTMFLPWYKKKELDFQALLKQTFWLADLEFKIRGMHPPHSWKGLTKISPKDHIVHTAMKLRNSRPKDKRTQNAFILKLKKYLAALKKEFGK